MSSSVFIINANNELTELSRSDYDSEDLFQGLLGDHPPLLNFASGTSGRLLLVRREAPVPEAEGSAGRWSLDHLFLDRDGVPVLVEVKRATDTRARREVVAQMLDYAANGVAYWPIEHIVESYAQTAGAESETKLREFLEGAEPEAFWRQVEANLRSGRVRMVFVADKIPKELRRIVEFLNEQMRPAEVLAIEVEQFTDPNGVRLLTPKLVGATERAASVKAVTTSKPSSTEEEWLASLAELKGQQASTNARRLLDWFREQGFIVGMTDSQDAMFARVVRADGKPSWPFFIRRSSAKLETALQYLKENPAFASEEARLALLARIKGLPGQVVATNKSTGWPGIPLAEFSNDDLRTGFLQIAVEVRDRATAPWPTQGEAAL